MRKNTKARRRKFKPTSRRKLSINDLNIINFLWTWKVASSPMLKQVGYKSKSQWWAYKALKQLEDEKYILRLPRGRNVEQELWTLTDHGFEVFLMDRDDINEYRHRVHAPAHDFLATCLQLGDYWLSSLGIRYITEQELSSLALSNFPKNVRPDRRSYDPSHIPDGLTIFPGGLNDVVVGYEVDLNLKYEDRYISTWRYYEKAEALVVIWLVKNMWIASRIREACKGFCEDHREVDEKLCFVLLDDFKSKVWEASVVSGKFKNLTLQKLHAKILQSVGKQPPKTPQNQMKDMFFPKYKSPQKLST